MVDIDLGTLSATEYSLLSQLAHLGFCRWSDDGDAAALTSLIRRGLVEARWNGHFTEVRATTDALKVLHRSRRFKVRPACGGPWMIVDRIEDAFVDADAGESYDVEVVEMTEAEVEALPEFNGW